MARRALLVLLFVLVLSAPASAATTSERKQTIDEKIARLRGRIEAANRKESVLSSQISVVTAKIRGLEDDVAASSRRVARLEAELVRYRNRLAVLTRRYREQSDRLALLRRENEAAQYRLARRLISVYESEDPTTIEVVFSSESITDLLDGIDYVGEIGRQDRVIATEVARSKARLRVLRAETARTRAGVARATHAVEVRTEGQRRAHYRLLASRQALSDARSAKRHTLASVQDDKREFIAEANALAAASARLAGQIRAAQASSPGFPSAPTSGAVSARGFVWPVHGPVTSGFGWRWGRMHEGIDIAVPTGTPVVAAAAGIVLVAGWEGGYGNLVVIDHGGGLATAYGHNSSLAVGFGQSVGQGQVIAYAGSTGHSTGPHVHFEVRVNGAPVDPLGYL